MAVEMAQPRPELGDLAQNQLQETSGDTVYHHDLTDDEKSLLQTKTINVNVASKAEEMPRQNGVHNHTELFSKNDSILEADKDSGFLERATSPQQNILPDAHSTQGSNKTDDHEHDLTETHSPNRNNGPSGQSNLPRSNTCGPSAKTEIPVQRLAAKFPGQLNIGQTIKPDTGQDNRRPTSRITSIFQVTNTATDENSLDSNHPPHFCSPRWHVSSCKRRVTIKTCSAKPAFYISSCPQQKATNAGQPRINQDEQTIPTSLGNKSPLTNSELSTDGGPLASNSLGSASSINSSSTEVRNDFVVLHADEDTEIAEMYIEHLEKDLGLENLIVHKLSDVDVEKTEMCCIGTLHNRYNFILTLVTQNFASDKHKRFLNEILLTCGLKEANGKEDRIVPVWMQRNSKTLVFEFISLKGLDFHMFQTTQSESLKTSYKKCVRRLIETGRKMNQ